METWLAIHKIRIRFHGTAAKNEYLETVEKLNSCVLGIQNKVFWRISADDFIIAALSQYESVNC